MKILQLTSRIPYPLTDGGAIGIYNITKYLHLAGHDVTVLALNTRKHFQNPDVMSDVCTRIYAVPINTDITVWRALHNLLFSKAPYNAERFYSADFAQQLVAILQHNKFDVIHVDSAFMAWYIDTIHSFFSGSQNRPPVVIRAHNVEYLISERLAHNATGQVKQWYLQNLAKRMKRFEQWYFDRCDGILAITPEDVNLIQNLGITKPVHVMPAGVDINFFSPDQTIITKPNTLFFFGSLDWMPNLEAIHWFMANVWNQIRQRLPELEFHIGGKNPPPEIQRYASLEKVFLHANVPSAPAFMQTYTAMVVPLLSGGGMRLKIVEAMAMAKPIISTTIGAEGIGDSPYPNLFRADSPDEMVSVIAKVFEDPVLLNTVSQNARLTAVNHYSWERVITHGVAFYQSLVHQRE